MHSAARLILTSLLWAVSACTATAATPVPSAPPPPMMVDGQPAERSIVTQEHLCFDQKIGLTFESDLSSIKLMSAHIDKKIMTPTQLDQFNELLGQVKRGYALVYFECALNGGFTVSFTEQGAQRLTLYFDTRKTVISSRQSLVPPPVKPSAITQ